MRALYLILFASISMLASGQQNTSQRAEFIKQLKETKIPFLDIDHRSFEEALEIITTEWKKNILTSHS